jgi:hypothetical protein
MSEPTVLLVGYILGAVAAYGLFWATASRPRRVFFDMPNAVILSALWPATAIGLLYVAWISLLARWLMR